MLKASDFCRFYMLASNERTILSLSLSERNLLYHACIYE